MQRQSAGAVTIQPIAWVIVLGIAAGFWALFIWSHFAPLPAAIVGLIFFITIHVLDAVLDPASLPQGLIMKIIVIAVLVKAISAALKYKKLQEAAPSAA